MNAYAAILCLVPVFLISLPLLADAAEMPAAGSVAPDFTLPAQDAQQGAALRSARHVGGPVFLSQGQHPGLHARAHNFARINPSTASARPSCWG